MGRFLLARISEALPKIIKPYLNLFSPPKVPEVLDLTLLDRFRFPKMKCSE